MRVFYSFHLPEHTAEMVLRDISSRFPIEPYPKSNLHVMVKFVGEVADASLGTLKDIGKAVAEHTPALSFAGKNLKLDKNGKLRLELKAEESAFVLHGEISGEVEAAGLMQPDQLPYTPSVTLGRAKEGIDLSSLPPGELMHYRFTVHELGLYDSLPGENKMGIYSLIDSFSLLGN